MENKVFFGENGLTSTSANHIANLAKEAYQEAEAKLNDLSFINKYVELINGSEKKQIKQGETEDDIKNYQKTLEEITQYKSLIAWLREALKAKAAYARELADLTTLEICGILGIEYPEKPERELTLTEEEYWNKQSIKQRNRYYHLDTLCAVYGMFIHPNRPFGQARSQFYKELKNPCDVRDSGVNLTIYTVEGSANAKLIEDTYFELQTKYREYQAQLNSMKYDCKLAVEDDYNQKQQKYMNELSRYSQVVKEISEKCEDYRKKQLEAASRLKIIIPDDLKEIYEKVSRLGK